MTSPLYRIAVVATLGVFLAASLVGLAVGGTARSAAQAVAIAFGALMVGVAAHAVSVAVRARCVDEEWNIVVVYAALRFGTGASAIWLGLGGRAIARWTLVVFVVAFPAWATLMRRRRGIS
jgi:hypothetical protein